MTTREEILARFELKPSDSNEQVIGNEIVKVSQEIESIYRLINFDHRPFLSRAEDDLDAKMTEEYRVGHACFKYAVSKVINPKLIAEIGVGSGTSALAFLAATPSARYLGIDSEEWGHRLGHDFLGHTQYHLSRLGYSYSVTLANSMDLERLKPNVYDLFHVDGDHHREAVRHDVALAWRSGARWILCDDSRDSAVVAGIFDALELDLGRGSVDWANFSDTWTGNILIRTDLP